MDTAEALPVFLTDFGLAKNVATGSRYTRTGETLGTPHYMSPEQARGELATLTPACDTWALGCVCYELLANRKAFEGETPAATIGAVLTARPPVPAHVPAPVATLLAALLAKTAAARPAHARAVAEDCRRILAGQRPLARAPRSRRGGVVVAVVAAVALAAGAVAWWPGGSPPAVPSVGNSEAAEWAAAGWAARSSDPSGGVELLAKACAAEPAQQRWRVNLGLLRWAAGDVAGARAAWGAVPPGDELHALGRLYTGLSHLFTFDAKAQLFRPDAARPVLAPLAAAPGRVGALARGALAAIDGDVAGTRTALAGAPGWEADYLVAWVEWLYGHDDPKAAEALTQALRTGPAFGWAYVNRALVHLKQGDYRRAFEDGDQAVKLSPRLMNAWAIRAQARSEFGQEVQARADYDRAIELAPRDWRMRYNRAKLIRDLGEPETALAEFREVHRLAPKEAMPLAEAGLLLRDQGRLQEALDLLGRALTLDPTLVPAYVNRSQTRVLLGDLDGALADAEAAVQADPRDPVAWRARGYVRVQRGEMALAEKDIAQTLRLAPDNPAPLMHLAFGYLHARQLERCIAVAERALAVDAQYVEALETAAVAHSRLGHIAQALALLDRAVAADPKAARVRVNRGGLRSNQGNLDGALEDLQLAVRLDPDNFSAWRSLAITQRRRGDQVGLRAALAGWSKLPSTDPEMLAHRGGLRLGCGDAAGAVTDLEAALRLAPPGWPYRRSAEQRLAEARAAAGGQRGGGR